MICPYCDYDVNSPEGTEGEFFTLGNKIVMERDSDSYDRTHNVEVRNVYGCPKCNKTFMDRY